MLPVADEVSWDLIEVLGQEALAGDVSAIEKLKALATSSRKTTGELTLYFNGGTDRKSMRVILDRKDKYGNLLRQQYGEEHSYVEHYRRLEQDVSSDPEAMVILASIYYLREQFHLAAPVYTRAAELGSNEAKAALGHMHLEGKHLPRDMLAAAPWFMKIFSHPNPVRQTFIFHEHRWPVWEYDSEEGEEPEWADAGLLANMLDAIGTEREQELLALIPNAGALVRKGWIVRDAD